LVGVRLRLGCAPDVPLQRLQAFLGLLYERSVDIDVEVTHLPTAEQLQRLRDGDLELGLAHDPGPADGVETEPVYPGEPLSAVVSLGHRVTVHDSIRLEDLAGEVLLIVPRRYEPGVHDRAAALATRDSPSFCDIREAPGADVRDLLFAVASGQGVAFVPRSAPGSLGALADTVTARPLTPASFMPDTVLAWPASARPELGGPHAAARDVARALYRAESITP
jgi:DNA-binding transcriptional LysR family regulator